MKLTHKKIGIWGFGVSGQSLLRYFTQQPEIPVLGILEKNLKPELLEPYAHLPAVTFYKDEPEIRQLFFDTHDIIIPSPGIDLRPYAQYAEKFLAEADLFYLLWGNPSSPELARTRKIIGITGTLGKTSITHLLSTLLPQAGIAVATGGNIGTGMFDLLQSDAPYALLELSSFQLEHCKHFTTDIGVITNLYPNHLDRHETMSNYAQAKYGIFMRQTHDQWAVLPLEWAEDVRKNEHLQSKPLAFFTKQTPSPDMLKHLIPGDKVYYCDGNARILRYTSLRSALRTSGIQNTTNNTNAITEILSHIPQLSYPENWIIIAAVLDLLNIDVQELISHTHNLAIPDYRLEKVATINEVSYYNDSKSTIMQATLAAVDALKKSHTSNIIVLLGGTSKGVDRTPFVKTLKDNVTHVICFGGEAQQLRSMCETVGIPATAAATLEDSMSIARSHARPHSAVVLSPGGASFDLFKDYKERGECFKKLVLARQ